MTAAMLVLPFLALAPAFPPATARTIEPGRELYPPEALAAGIEGDVPVSLQVDATGRLRCVARGGTAVAALKRASCQLIADRDVFLPARGADGQPAANAFELVVRWRTGADGKQFGGAVPIGRATWMTQTDIPGGLHWNLPFAKVRVDFDVTPGGHVENCSVGWSNGGTVVTSSVCPTVTRRALFLPALSVDGQPRRVRGWFWIRWVGETSTQSGSLDAGSDGRTLP